MSLKSCRMKLSESISRANACEVNQIQIQQGTVIDLMLGL